MDDLKSTSSSKKINACINCPLPDDCNDKNPACLWAQIIGIAHQSLHQTTPEIDNQIRAEYAAGDTSYRKLSRKYGLSRKTTTDIIKRNRKKDRIDG